MKQDIQKYKLLQEVQIEARMICGNCGDISVELTNVVDTTESIDGFYSLGWRVRRGECLCPKCFRNKRPWKEL